MHGDAVNSPAGSLLDRSWLIQPDFFGVCWEVESLYSGPLAEAAVFGEAVVTDRQGT
jgi:hypothetical protein